MNPIENALLQHMEQEAINKIKQVDPRVLLKFVEDQVATRIEAAQHLTPAVVNAALAKIEAGFKQIWDAIHELEGK